MRKGQKVLALMITVTMAISLAACNNAKPKQAQTGISSDLMKPFSRYSKPVTITVARQTNRGGQFAKGESTSNNGVLNVIKKKLNVDVKIAWETDPGSYKQKLALSIASNALPDTFVVDDYLTFRALAESGKLADLTQLYKVSIGGFAKTTIDSYKNNPLKPFEVNNKLYGIAAPQNGYTYNFMWIRNDWLKKLNLPVPQTMDDVKNVAKAFVDKDPGGNGAGKTVGMILNPTDPLADSSNFYSATTIANAVGAFPNRWITGKDGKVVWGNVTPEMKTALGTMADWYKSGVFDKSFMTYKSVDEETPYILNNQAGIFFCGWWGPWVYSTMFKAHPEADWIPVMAPLDSDGKFKHTNPMEPTSCQVISKTCKNPEAVVKAMNVQFDAESMQFDSDPEILAMLKPEREQGGGGRTIDPFSAIANYASMVPDSGKAITDYIKTGNLTLSPLLASQKQPAEDVMAYYKNKGTATQAQRDTFGAYTLGAPLTLDPRNVDVPIAYSYTTESMADLWPSMTALDKQTMIQIICGQKPLSYFDDYVAQWKKAGGDVITKEVQDIVNKSK
ncbi:MAG TPA: extracellular solute-binding protein [Ruminiclostridium sp.]